MKNKKQYVALALALSVLTLCLCPGLCEAPETEPAPVQIVEVTEAVSETERAEQTEAVPEAEPSDETDSRETSAATSDTVVIHVSPEDKTSPENLFVEEGGKTVTPGNWSAFYDETTGHYSLTYTLTEETLDENISLDLSAAQDAIAALNKKHGLDPGMNAVFDITIASESGHTYRYTTDSFRLEGEKGSEDFFENMLHFAYGEEAAQEAVTVEQSSVTYYSVTDPDNGRVCDCVVIPEALAEQYGLEPDTLIYWTSPSTWRVIMTEDGIATAGSFTKSSFEADLAHVMDGWGLSDSTVADYTNPDSTLREEANRYFSNLLAQGVNKNHATWATMQMAFGVDASARKEDWSVVNTIELERVDGNLSLRVEDQNGSRVTPTSGFQLWYVEDKDEGKTNFYLSYDAETDSYGFTPEASTINTTRGELKIDYALLEDMVYYLRQTQAVSDSKPETDENGAPIVYVIMPEDFATEDVKTVFTPDANLGTKVSYRYAGAIDSEKPLTIVIVNERASRATTGTTTAAVNGVVTIGEYDIPLSGSLNFNEGDCVN